MVRVVKVKHVPGVWVWCEYSDERPLRVEIRHPGRLPGSHQPVKTSHYAGVVR
jgi:hypothetical protein